MRFGSEFSPDLLYVVGSSRPPVLVPVGRCTRRDGTRVDNPQKPQDQHQEGGAQEVPPRRVGLLQPNHQVTGDCDISTRQLDCSADFATPKAQGGCSPVSIEVKPLINLWSHEWWA